MCKSPFVVSTLAVVWLLAAGQSLALEPRADVAKPPPHASGGIGDDDPLASMSGEYNLQLVFAMQGSGEYLADIRVLIADVKDRPLLEAESPGPLFYVRLPTGTYRISADFHGTSLRKSVLVTGRGLQSVYFHWPHSEVETQKRRP